MGFGSLFFQCLSLPPLHTGAVLHYKNIKDVAMATSFILKPSLVCLRFNLFDTGLFTGKCTQVVKFSTTNTTTLVDCDAVDCG